MVAVDVNSLELHEEATIELGSSLFAVEAIADHLWVAGLRGFNLFRTEPRLAGSAFDNVVIRVEAAPGGNAGLAPRYAARSGS